MEGCDRGKPAPQAWQSEQDEVLAACHPCPGGEACSACAQALPILQGRAAGSILADRSGAASTLDAVKGCAL